MYAVAIAMIMLPSAPAITVLGATLMIRKIAIIHTTPMANNSPIIAKNLQIWPNISITIDVSAFSFASSTDFLVLFNSFSNSFSNFFALSFSSCVEFSLSALAFAAAAFVINFSNPAITLDAYSAASVTSATACDSIAACLAAFVFAIFAASSAFFAAFSDVFAIVVVSSIFNSSSITNCVVIPSSCAAFTAAAFAFCASLIANNSASFVLVIVLMDAIVISS